MSSKYVVRILGDDKDFNRATKGVKGKLSELGRSVTSLQGLFAGLGAAISFRGILDATIRQENAMRQLEARVRSTGGAAGYTAADLGDMASSLQQLTTYGDEAIMEMQGLLLTFTEIRGPVFQEATSAVLNMSTALGTDLRSSALQLGKALNDPIRGVSALGEAGIQFNDSQRETIKQLVETGRVAEAQGVILAELEVQFGGAAEAATDTLGGALTQLSNAFGDLLEADNLGGAPDAIRDLTRTISDPAIVEAFGKVTTAAVKLIENLASGITTVVDFTEAMGEIAAGASGFGAEYDAYQDAIEERQALIAKNERMLWGTFTEQGEAEINARIKKLREEIAQYKELQATIWDRQAASPSAPQQARTPARPPAAVAAEEQSTESADAAAKAAEKAAAAHEKWMEQQRRAAEQVKASIDPNYNLINQLAELDQLLQLGLITWDQWAEAQLRVQEQMDGTADKANEASKQVSEFSLQAARGIQDALADYLFDPFEAGLKGMLRAFTDTLRRMAAEAIAAKLAEKMFGDGSGGGGSGGGSGGGWVGAAVNFAASFFHSGGMVGHGGGQRRAMPAYAWAGAPRLHTGGYLKSDEVPAVLQTGEEVLSRNDPRNAANGGGGAGTRIVNVIDPNMVSDYLSSSSGEKVLVNVLQRNAGAIKQVLV